MSATIDRSSLPASHRSAIPQVVVRRRKTISELASITANNGPDDTYMAIMLEPEDHLRIGVLAGHGRVTTSRWLNLWEAHFLDNFRKHNGGRYSSRGLNNPFTRDEAMFLAQTDCTDELWTALVNGQISAPHFISHVGLALLRYRSGVFGRDDLFAIQREFFEDMLIKH